MDNGKSKRKSFRQWVKDLMYAEGTYGEPFYSADEVIKERMDDIIKAQNLIEKKTAYPNKKHRQITKI